MATFFAAVLGGAVGGLVVATVLGGLMVVVSARGTPPPK